MGVDTKEQSTVEKEEVEVSGIALGDNEVVIHYLHPAWTNYVRQLLVGVITLPIIIGVVPLARAWKGRKTTSYIVTTERLIFKEKSLLGGAETTEYELANVEQIETEQSVLEKRFDVGTVTVYMRHQHHEAERFDVTIPSVPDYHEVAQTLREQGTEY